MSSTTPYDATGRRAAAIIHCDPYGETDPIVSRMSVHGPKLLIGDVRYYGS
jgi:hypothetical protein